MKIALGLLSLVTVAAASSFALAAPARISACAPGYTPCLPAAAGDLNCDEIAESKKPIRVTGSDPYALDRDRDGLGCERSDNTANTWGLVIRQGKKEAVTTKVGDSLKVVGWSPSSASGAKYELCAARGSGMRCVPAKRALTQGVQVLGAWKVASGEGRKGNFTLSLRVKGRSRAADSVRLA